jgi:hypothetical protein
LDDAVIIPASVFAALRFAARELVSEGRSRPLETKPFPMVILALHGVLLSES